MLPGYIRSYNSTPQTDQQLKKLAESLKLSKSEIIRNSIESEYVRKSGEDAKRK